MGDGVMTGDKRKGVILLDVDQVVADLHSVWLAVYNAEYGDTLTPDGIQKWAIHQYVKPACGSKIYRYLEVPGLYDRVKPIPGARHGVTVLRSWGFRVAFVTSANPQAAKDKMLWLGNHGFLEPQNGGPRHRDVVIAQDKSFVAGDVLVDDYVENLRTSPAKYRILFDQPHNRGEEWEPRVKGWDFLIAHLAYHFQLPLRASDLIRI